MDGYLARVSTVPIVCSSCAVVPDQNAILQTKRTSSRVPQHLSIAINRGVALTSLAAIRISSDDARYFRLIPPVSTFISGPVIMELCGVGATKTVSHTVQDSSGQAVSRLLEQHGSSVP
jgi:hypothetical protein